MYSVSQYEYECKFVNQNVFSNQCTCKYKWIHVQMINVNCHEFEYIVQSSESCPNIREYVDYYMLQIFESHCIITAICYYYHYHYYYYCYVLLLALLLLLLLLWSRLAGSRSTSRICWLCLIIVDCGWSIHDCFRLLLIP